jgi:hypothetical protein
LRKSIGERRSGVEPFRPSAIETATFSGRRNVGLRLHGRRRAIAVPATAKRFISCRVPYRERGEEMFASPSDAPDPSGRWQPVRSEDVPPLSPAADPGLLEKVLRETEELLEGDQALDGREKDDLRGVARRHRGEPLSLDPVTVELVQAVVGSRFRSRPDSVDFWRELVLHVAQSIFDDPASHDRLKALWSRLGEGEP